MASTKLSYLAVKRQTSDGSLAVVPTHFLRFQEGDIVVERENIVNQPIANNAWGALNVTQGKEENDLSWKFDLDANECVHWIAAALGGLSSADTSSGTDASVYTHTITIGALPWLSVEQAWGDTSDTSNNRQNYHVARAYGVRVADLTIRGAEGMVEMDVKAKALGVFHYGFHINDEAAGSSVVCELDSVEGLVNGETINTVDDTPQNETDAIASLSSSAKTITIGTLGSSYTKANNARVELVPLSPSFSVAQQLFSVPHVNVHFHASSIASAESAAETDVETWEFAFSNNLDAKHGTKRAGYTVLESMFRSAKFKFTKYFESMEDHKRYMARLRRAISVVITNNIRISATDTGLLKYRVRIQMTDCKFTSHQMQTGNANLWYYQIEAECLYNTSDAYAIKCIVDNAMVGTTYTA